MRLRLALLACALFALAVLASTALATPELPAIARPRLPGQGNETAAGTVFFLRAPVAAGAVAVGAAHSFDFPALASAGQLEFRLGRSGKRVALSTRFQTPPGVPFSAPGATLRDDFVVFALEAAPYGVRLLQTASAPPQKGARVRLLGVPTALAHDEDDLFGRIEEVSETRLEVELDVPVDLAGWGGAPVLDAESGHVMGLLQAAWPGESGLRLGVAPISGVSAALARPIEGGAAFSQYAGHAAGHTPAPPPPRDSDASSTTTASARPPRSAAEPEASRAEPPGPHPAPGEPLMGRAGAVETKLQLEIELPGDGAVIGDEQGAFLAGRAFALVGELRRFDVVFVLDTSGSAAQMSGSDVNGNGVVGQDRLGGLLGGNDPGDSILASEVAAARRVLRGLDPRSTRVGLVTFAGSPPGSGGLFSRGQPPAAFTEEVLTTDYARVESALSRVLARGADGLTHMAAGVDQAIVELLGLKGGLSEPDPKSEKVVLFFTDGQPTLPYDSIFEADNVKAVLRAADRARRAEITIHSFAIGPEALEGPIATVEMAERTEGYFTPVRDPGDLVSVIENVSFANLESVTVKNLRTGESAGPLVVNADGSWSALVPLEPGKNRIEVVARGQDGTTARAERTLEYAPGAPETLLSQAQMTQRNRLLEQRLLELKRDRASAEREAAERTRNELVLEIDEERARAREQAERQRKELELEAERTDEGTPAP